MLRTHRRNSQSNCAGVDWFLVIRRRTVRGLKLGEVTVCVNVTELSGKNHSPVLDNDSRVLVLSPAVTGNLSEGRLSGTSWDCSLVSFSPQQTVVVLSSSVVVVAVATSLFRLQNSRQGADNQQLGS